MENLIQDSILNAGVFISRGNDEDELTDQNEEITNEDFHKFVCRIKSG